MQQEEVKDIPLIYPLVSVTLKTTTIVDGRAVVSECEEVVNALHDGRKHLGKLLKEFKVYVTKVIEAAQSPQARAALQNILENQLHPPLLLPEDHPWLQDSGVESAQGTLPPDPPEE